MEKIYAHHVARLALLSRDPGEEFDEEDFRPKYKPKLKSPKMTIKTKFVSEKSEKSERQSKKPSSYKYELTPIDFLPVMWF